MPIFQTRHHHGSKLHHISICSLTLHQKVRRQTQLAPFPTTRHAGPAERAIDLLRIICHDRHVIPPGHQFPIVGRLPRDVVAKQLHHVLLGVRGLGRSRARAVGGDIERFVVVEKFEDVRGRWSIDHGRGDELVHCLMVGRVGRVVNETSAAGVDGSRQEGEADGALFRDALERADQIGTLEVLHSRSVMNLDQGEGGTYL